MKADVDGLEDAIDEAVGDGVYDDDERAAIEAAFRRLRFTEKIALLREVAAAMKSMPGAGDHGAWNALLDAQEHLRGAMPGAAAAPPRSGPHFNDAKRLLRQYATDGRIDNNDRILLKGLLRRAGAHECERLLKFCRRREYLAASPARQRAFVEIRRFVEDHIEAAEWDTVKL